MSKLLTENFDFRGHLSTFQAENTPKSRHFKAKNNALTLPEQLQSNFEKVQNTTFSTSKICENTSAYLAKNVDILGQKFAHFGRF